MENTMQITIQGFLSHPKTNARGGVFQGRFTCPAVQWTGSGSDAFVTFTITAEELSAAAASRLLWTDQTVQRGIRPGLSVDPAREISLAEGYPNPDLYMFDATNADDMVQKLLEGERVFFNPLVWNLRPRTFEAYWDGPKQELYLYDGRIYLPDSHHRQQAIAKAVSIWKQAPASYPAFSPGREFKVELYFLSREAEGDYFYDKNQRSRPTALSKAYDLTTQDDLSLLAKRLIEKCAALRDNVNRVTDRLAADNPQVVTLSTLREMMKAFAPDGLVDESELDGLSTVGATFYDLLASVRPELGVLERAARHRVRKELLVDSAVMMHGYAAVMREFHQELAGSGIKKAAADWRVRLSRLSHSRVYSCGEWSGDVFAKVNPLWQSAGVVKPGKTRGSTTVLNTGAARAKCGRILKQLLAVPSTPTNLEFLAKG